MKKYIIPLFVMFVSGVNAQSSYDAAKMLDNDLSGTARYVSMGGSMSALGTDISVMGVNPAGIGLYRSGDAAVTMGVTSLLSKSDCAGNVEESEKTFFTVDNAGVVLASEVDFDAVKYVNVGFAYKRRNNLKREFLMAGATDGFSQMYQMQRLYDASPFNINNMSYKDYVNLDHSWLALLGADGGLLDAASDPQGELMYPDTEYMEYGSKENGGVDQIDCNIACNIDDRVYLGLTVGIYNVDYERSSYYGEDDAFGPLYTIYNEYATEGAGFDMKLGTIIRPFEESSFRIGFALHTPTWYSLTDRMWCDMYGPGFDGAPYDGYMSTLDYEYAYGDVYCVDYRLTTPWRYNISAAYTIGSSFAINAEYEYADYSSARMRYSDGDKIKAMNEEIKSNMKEVNTFKIGAECKISKNLSLRGGYNYSSAPYKADAAKVMMTMPDTNTEYLNSMEQRNYTLGFGYRNNAFYVDAAYVLSVRESDFYPFYDYFSDEHGNVHSNAATTVKDTKNRFMVTAGIRF